ncbi:MAG: cytochrome P450 [Alphaproteobacteria bacterium]|nr:cytochrome P450 [Alphaproteobacteria bacterium]
MDFPMTRPTTTIDISSPDAYANETLIADNLRRVRNETPVAWVEQEPYAPFWAILKHADIMEIERLGKVFINEPRLTLLPEAFERKTIETFGSRTGLVRTLLDMDEPDHRKFRQITQVWFNGPALEKLRMRMAALAREYVDKLEDLGGACDFAEDIAVHYPLVMITSILGLPDEDVGLVLRLTQSLFGAQDPERVEKGDYGVEAAQEFFAYLSGIVAERRRAPRDDLMSVIANAQIDGEPIRDIDALSYGMLLAAAGHDTTSASLSVGMLALARRPDQQALLKSEPDAARTASDEFFRWATPVRHFVRTAVADHEIRGVKIAKGEAVTLMYLSGNRDEEAFEEADALRVLRAPNRHLGFGFGPHHCLGRVLAEMELEAFLREFAARFEWIEPAGEAEWVRTNHTGGLKRFPVRYAFR